MTAPNSDPAHVVSSLVAEYTRRRKAILLHSFNAELKEFTDYFSSGDTESWHDLCTKEGKYWTLQLKLPE